MTSGFSLVALSAAMAAAPLSLTVQMDRVTHVATLSLVSHAHALAGPDDDEEEDEEEEDEEEEDDGSENDLDGAPPPETMTDSRDSDDEDPDEPDADGDDGDEAAGPTGTGGSGGDDDGPDDDDDDGPTTPTGGGMSGGGGSDDDNDDDDDDDSAPTPAGGSTSGPGSGGGDRDASDDDDDDDGPTSPTGAGTSDGGGAGAEGAPGQGGETGPPSGAEAGTEALETAAERSDRTEPLLSEQANADAAADVAVAVYVGVEPDRVRRELDEQQGIERDDQGFRYRGGEIVAIDLDKAQLDRLMGEKFSTVRREELPALGTRIVILKPPVGMDDEEAIARLEIAGLGQGAGLNHLYDRASVRTARGPAPRREPRQACGCRIGIIDTGVANAPLDATRSRLVQRAFNGQTPAADTHGTVVASLIGGTQPFPGRATTLVVGDIFSGPRDAAGSSFALIRALNWMAEQKVAVINVSLAGPYNKAVAATLERLAARGHIIVAAAGNDGPAAPPAYPAAYPNVIAVTAIDDRGQIYRYANRGPYVDFAAKGVDVVGLDAKGQPRRVTGTSFAAPVVAMRLARQLETPDPPSSRAAVRRVEQQATDAGAPGRDPVFGAGIVAEGP